MPVSDGVVMMERQRGNSIQGMGTVMEMQVSPFMTLQSISIVIIVWEWLHLLDS